MTETTIIAITASVLATIAPTIAALAAYRQTKKNGVITQKNDEKTDTLMNQVEDVRVLSNGNLVVLRNELAVLRTHLTQANTQIANLQTLVGMLVPRLGVTAAQAETIAQLKENEQKSEDQKG